MKKNIFSLIFLLTSFVFSAQQIEIAPVYLKTDYFRYRENYGMELFYNFNLDKHKLGFGFSYVWNKDPYSFKYFSSADGREYLNSVNPDNKLLTFSMYFGYNLFKKWKNAGLYIGPLFGLSYFYIHEDTQQTDQENNETYNFIDEKVISHRPSMALRMEFEKNLTKSISVFSAFEPGMLLYQPPGMLCVITPDRVLFYNMKVGLRVNLK